jgi:hypothetical protein
MGAAQYHMGAVGLAVMLALLVMGCVWRPPPPATPNARQQLLGKWAMAGWEFSMTFAADGTLVRNVEGQETSGTFAISSDGKRLGIDYADGTTLNTAFALDGDTLVLAMDEPGGETKEPITLIRSS